MTSEHALGALEQSKQPLVELLDNAASIVNLHRVNDPRDYEASTGAVSSSDTGKCREQWVLKWLLKRLAQASNPKAGQETPGVEALQDTRTWALLSHVLSVISAPVAQEILVERQFSQVFDHCLKIVIGRLPTISHNHGDNSSHEASDGESGRPVKKRRLSGPTQETAQIETYLPSYNVTDKLLEVAGWLFKIFSPESAQTTSALKNHIGWSNSLDAATSFTGHIVQLADASSRLAKKVPWLGTPLRPLFVAAVWLNIWQQYVSRKGTSSKQSPSLAFNQHILMPLLRLLDHRSIGVELDWTMVVDRQIAKHTILPMRATFQKRFAAAWKSRTKEPSAKDVELLVQETTKCLGTAAKDFKSLDGSTRAADLLNIASRLVPQHDAQKRSAEAAWLEALFLSLSSLTQQDRAKDSSCTVSESLLHALERTGNALSVPFWRHYVRHTVLQPGIEVPFSIAAQIVALNSSTFVPDANDREAFFLEGLSSYIDQRIPRDRPEQVLIIDKILAPVIASCARSRKLPDFIRCWESKLADTFLSRTTVHTLAQSRLHVWDHPDTVKYFIMACRQFASPLLCTSLFESVKNDIKDLPQIVGLTHQVFARVTVFTQILQGLHSSPVVKSNLDQEVQSLCDLSVAALRRSNDYQGHRWRIWKLLGLLDTIYSGSKGVALPREVGPLLPDLVPFRAKDGTSHPLASSQAAMMECFYAYSLITTSHGASLETADLLEIAVNAAAELLDQCLLVHADLHSSLKSWDGSIDDMNSTFKLLSAYINQLTTVPPSWTQTLPPALTQRLLVGCYVLASSLLQKTNASDADRTSLLRSVEGLLSAISKNTTLDLVDQFLHMAENGSSRFRNCKPLLQLLQEEHVKKSQAEKLAKTILQAMNHSEQERGRDVFVDCLACLRILTTDHPATMSTPENLDSLKRSLNNANTGLNLAGLVLADTNIRKIMKSLTECMSSSTNSSYASSLIHDLLDNASKSRKKADSKKKGNVFDQYVIFMVLALVRLAPSIKSTANDDNVVSAASKLERRFREMAPEFVKGHTTDSTKIEDVYKAWCVLQAQADLEGDQTLLAEEVAGLEEIRTSIVAFVKNIRCDALSAEVPSDILLGILRGLKNISRDQSKQLELTEAQEIISEIASHESSSVAVLTQKQLAINHLRSIPIFIDKNLEFAASGKRNIREHWDWKNDMGQFLSLTLTIKLLSTKQLVDVPERVIALGELASLENAVLVSDAVKLICWLELSKVIFNKHPAIVNQHVIDTLLRSIVLLTSSSCSLTLVQKGVDSVQPSHIYNRLLTLLQIILSRPAYRRRLNDRHHLLISTLQSLLRCLFYTNKRSLLASPTSSSTSKPFFLTNLPNWLTGSNHTLTSSDAEKLSRTLQTLSCPSASAARSLAGSKRNSDNNKPNLNLNDEVLALRKHVSQHTQYLIQSYCTVTLEGYIAPEVKEKLLPGLFAVIGGMEKEIMRGMNAAMSSAGREVWRDLYQEYRRQSGVGASS